MPGPFCALVHQLASLLTLCFLIACPPAAGPEIHWILSLRLLGSVLAHACARPE